MDLKVSENLESFRNIAHRGYQHSKTRGPSNPKTYLDVGLGFQMVNNVVSLPCGAYGESLYGVPTFLMPN